MWDVESPLLTLASVSGGLTRQFQSRSGFRKMRLYLDVGIVSSEDGEDVSTSWLWSLKACSHLSQHLQLGPRMEKAYSHVGWGLQLGC